MFRSKATTRFPFFSTKPIISTATTTTTPKTFSSYRYSYYFFSGIFSAATLFFFSRNFSLNNNKNWLLLLLNQTTQQQEDQVCFCFSASDPEVAAALEHSEQEAEIKFPSASTEQTRFLKNQLSELIEYAKKEQSTFDEKMMDFVCNKLREKLSELRAAAGGEETDNTDLAEALTECGSLFVSGKFKQLETALTFLKEALDMRSRMSIVDPSEVVHIIGLLNYCARATFELGQQKANSHMQQSAINLLRESIAKKKLIYANEFNSQQNLSMIEDGGGDGSQQQKQEQQHHFILSLPNTGEVEEGKLQQQSATTTTEIPMTMAVNPATFENEDIANSTFALGNFMYLAGQHEEGMHTISDAISMQKRIAGGNGKDDLMVAKMLVALGRMMEGLGQDGTAFISEGMKMAARVKVAKKEEQR